jgi:hypothetical protein
LLNVLDRRPDAVLRALTESNVIAAAHDGRPDPN